MDIFSFITLFGGLAFFLYGMHVMSTGLEKMAGSKLEGLLKKMTDNPFKGLLLGIGITIAIQSSSAMTVMLVGLVNSGIMQIGQTIGVIMGSNIGTTLTAWMLSLIGLESSNVWLNLLKPENFSLIFALVGVILLMMSKKAQKRDIGTIMVGFAVLMFGMKLMSDAVSPLADMPQFSALLTAFQNPILGVLVGAVFTGIIQSSAASVGILQALALTGSISYGMAIPIIMGQNIGTCVTALISSIGVNRNAKKVAIIHISFNLIGTIVCLTLYYVLDAFIHFTFTDEPIGAVGIAAVHSIFNVFTTILLFPFSHYLEKISNAVLRDKQTTKSQAYELLDTRLLATPSVAVIECYNLTEKMALIADEAIKKAASLFTDYKEETINEILQAEDQLDLYEDKIGTFMVKISSNGLSDKDSQTKFKVLHCIGDFERLGDHAVNLIKVAQEIHDKGIEFSNEAKAELNVLVKAIDEIMEITLDCYKNDDLRLASKVEPFEQVIDGLIKEIKSKHVERLGKGDCTIEMGFILSDLLTNYERISDHCSNIAVAVIETKHNSFGTHEYLNSIKNFSNTEFNETFNEYAIKYSI